MTAGKIIIFIALAALAAGLTDAATIRGIAYDTSLNRMENIRVDINTTPRQSVIAQNGSYAFSVENGFYVIKAQAIIKSSVLSSAEENLSIKNPGDYVRDMILFPNIDEGVEDIGIDLNEDVMKGENPLRVYFISLSIFLLLAFSSAGYFLFSGRKSNRAIAKESVPESIDSSNEEFSLQSIIDILNEEGGRTTQKHIRKRIPLSEAKISLMIAELEHKGAIQKIKKGRGNLIILNKKRL